MKKINISDHLQAIPLFKGLSGRELREVEAIIHQREFRDMEVISQAGEPSLAIYIIKKGEVNIVIGKPGAEGKIIETFTAGDSIGEICLFDEGPRPATMISVGDSEVFGILKHDIEELMKRNKRIGLKIMKNVGKKLAKRIRKLTYLAYEQSKEEK